MNDFFCLQRFYQKERMLDIGKKKVLQTINIINVIIKNRVQKGKPVDALKQNMDKCQYDITIE